MARSEKFRSLILTEDSEFKRKTSAMLNNIAFVADKLSTRTVTELIQQIDASEHMRNLIIDLRSPSLARELLASDALATRLRTIPELAALIYVEAVPVMSLVTCALGDLHNVNIVELPIDRAHFMEIFYTRRKARATSAPRRPVNDDMRAAAQEAAQHLKTALEQINGIAVDPSKLEYLAVIGQRFNGMMGTFAFFATTPGAKELAEIGRIVDGIARSYEKKQRPAVDQAHLKLLVSCCRSTLPLLRALAFGDPVPPEAAREVKIASAAFEGDSTLIKRQGISQTRIDAAISTASEQESALRQAFVETSQHLKAAIEHLNIVFKDRARLDSLATIGQLFNGVFGTFAFYHERVGASALIDLSVVIDDLCRSYGDAAPGESIADEHVALLRAAAETCLYMLRDLREGRQPAEEHKLKVGDLVAAAKNDPRIGKRQSIGQNDVDQLLDDLMAA